MAVYKVPQDVEADDKLIGPFSFRQFIYLIIVAISIAAAWGFSQIFIPLAIIPLPIIIFFAVLALPLRKDQPMETYLSAVVSFYFLKSRVRFWQPDGIFSFITIIPPKDADKILTKNLNEDEANQRLGYLADLVDTHGWAIRGAAVADTSISTDLYYESQQLPDMMDSTSASAQAMTQQLDSKAADQRQTAISGMQTAATQAPVTPQVPVAMPEPTVVEPLLQTPVVSPVVQVASQPIVVDEPPVSTLPPVAEIRAKTPTISATDQQSGKESRDAVAYATALAEEASEERDIPIATPTNETAVNIAAKPTAEPAINTSVSTPDTGTMELTQNQADELSQHADVTVATLAQQAERVAKKNKELHDGDEVTISFR